MSELEKLFTEAIEVCEQWRKKRKLVEATPNEIGLYNVFTEAKRSLESQLACIQDVQGNYNVKEK